MKHKWTKERPERDEDILQTTRDPSVAIIPTPILRTKALPPSAKIAYVGVADAVAAILDGDMVITDQEVADSVGLSGEEYLSALKELEDFGLVQVTHGEGQVTVRIVRTHPIFIDGYIVRTTPEEAQSRKRRL